MFSNDKIKDRFAEHLATTLQRYEVRLLAWVIMPDHIHLILLPGDEAAIGPVLNALKNTFAREVLGRWRTLNAAILPKLRGLDGSIHFWQAGGGYDRNAVGAELAEKIRYVHANPLRRGLAANAVSWRWSSANAYSGGVDAFGLRIDFELVPREFGPFV